MHILAPAVVRYCNITLAKSVRACKLAEPDGYSCVRPVDVIYMEFELLDSLFDCRVRRRVAYLIGQT